MRTNLQIRRIPQRMICRQRFRIRHIHSSTTQLPSLQRSNQGILINDLPARNIGHVGPGEGMCALSSEEREFFRANEMGALRS